MNEKIQKLLNNRNKLKKEIEDVQLDNQEIMMRNKKFNKNMLKIFLASFILTLPMALYTIPIIPTTTTMAGATWTGLTPILPKTVPLNFLMYSCFIGGLGMSSSTMTFIIVNLLYYIPVKIIGKKSEYELQNKKQVLNRRILNEYNKRKTNNINKTNNQTSKKEIPNKRNTKYSYQYKKNNYDSLIKNETIGKNKVRKRNNQIKH